MIATKKELRLAARYVPIDHWPCKRCGAKGPAKNGHDPCIKNLPGVQFACCGHGKGQAYVFLKSGHVIRGWFDVSGIDGRIISHKTHPTGV